MSPAPLDSFRAILTTVARPTFERVRLDQDRVTGGPRQLLRYFEHNLFNPALTGKSWRTAAGLGLEAAGHFQQCFGISPARYLRDRRLEIAARLLDRPGLQIQQIGQLVGYARTTTFGLNFKLWAGQSPSEFRRKRTQRREELDARLGEPSAAHAETKAFIFRFLGLTDE